jgi:hypothetical protein
MSNRKKLVEQRKHKRFRVPKGLFAALSPSYTKVGSVVDMSMKGLAFRYMDRGKPSNGAYMDIFTNTGDFHLRDVPLKTISDFACDGIPLSSIKMRQCAVQFGDLTSYQKGQLAHLIKEHTKGKK